MKSPGKPFDSNSAWQQAAATITANREVLFALAGVFFLLPTLFFALLFPQPEPPAGADEKAMMAMALQYYAQTMPIAIPVALVEAAGTLALLTLMTDRSRPTVGQAIRMGFLALFPYIASQLLLGAGAGIAGLILLGILGLSGSQAIVTAGFLALAAAGVYLWVRMSLSAPAVAVEGIRNPIRALRRSWALTRGNGWRVLAFYGLLFLVFVILITIVMALVGIVLGLLLPAKAAAIVSAVVGSTLQSTMALVLVGAIAATHAQLAGEPAEQAGRAFD